MANARDHRHRAVKHGAGHGLVVERPQVFHGTATAHQQDDVDVHRSLRGAIRHRQGVELLQGLANLGGSALPLHTGRRQHHGNVGHPALQGGHHIVQSGSAQRSHYANAPHLARQRAFVGGIKQTQGLELGLEQQKLLKQSALACAGHAFDHQLELTARLVHTELARDFHPLAVARRKFQAAGRAFEHGALDLAALIFERKIAVAAGRAHKATDLAAHTHRVEARVQGVGDGVAQRAHTPHARRGAGQRRGAGGLGGHGWGWEKFRSKSWLCAPAAGTGRANNPG